MDEWITELAPNDVFVFGSNLAGRHGAGAALQAAKQFGCEYGLGEGMSKNGKCYAFPTLDERFRQLSPECLLNARRLT